MMNVSDTRDCAFKAFITNLGKYNEGFLVGEWVKFPVTNEEMQAVLSASASGGAMRNGSSPTMTARMRPLARYSENTRA